VSSCAIPFFVVRLVYALLTVFSTDTATWSALTGSIAPFVVMGLLMEYIVVGVYLYTGYTIPVGDDIHSNTYAYDQEAAAAN
jgi:uncharacterized membrane protein